MKKYNNEEIVKRVEKLRINSAMTNNQFANYCGVDQGNLSKARSGKMGYSELVLMRIAQAMKVSFEWLTTGCGLCGVDGDKAFDDLNTEFQAQRGGTNVVGNHNNVNNNNVYNSKDDAQKSAIDIFSDNISGLMPASQSQSSEVFKKLLKMERELEALKKENEMKDKQIAQLEKDKMFYQTLLEKR